MSRAGTCLSRRCICRCFIQPGSRSDSARWGEPVMVPTSVLRGARPARRGKGDSEVVAEPGLDEVLRVVGDVIGLDAGAGRPREFRSVRVPLGPAGDEPALPEV